MAAPTVVGAGAFVSGSSATLSLTPPLPAGWAADDIAICVVSQNAADDLTFPAGWTKFAIIDNGSRRGTFAWKRLTAGDTDPTITRTAGANWSADVIAYRGVRTAGDPWDVAPTTRANAASTTGTATGLVTTTTDNRAVMILTRAGGGGAALSGWNAAVLGPLTEDNQWLAGPGGGIASTAMANPGPTGDGTVTIASVQQSEGVMLALVSSTSVAPPPPSSLPTRVGARVGVVQPAVPSVGL